jgi:hypothetical protein
MSSLIVFKDIDLILDLNSYNDFKVLTNAKAIINTFKNNLLVHSKDRYFENTDYLSITSLLHKTMSPGVEEAIEEIIKDAAARDTRIKNVTRIDITQEDYDLLIGITLSLDVSIDEEINDINFDLILRD